MTAVHASMPRLQLAGRSPSSPVPARVDFVIAKFKRCGFLEDDGRLKVNDSLLSVVLPISKPKPVDSPAGVTRRPSFGGACAVQLRWLESLSGLPT
jgi:hypothetical protein